MKNDPFKEILKKCNGNFLQATLVANNKRFDFPNVFDSYDTIDEYYTDDDMKKWFSTYFPQLKIKDPCSKINKAVRYVYEKRKEVNPTLLPKIGRASCRERV